MNTFVFLELTDRGINALFLGIAEILYGQRPSRAPHMTLRGPYKKSIPESHFQEFAERLKGAVLEIGRVGRFRNGSEHVVYLGVDCPSIKRVWWKPDYPVSKYGRNPHFTIYRGDDVDLADTVERFFKHEDLQMQSSEFRLVRYVSKQNLIFDDEVPFARYSFHELIVGNVSSNILDRFALAVQRCRRRNAQRAQANQESSGARWLWEDALAVESGGRAV